MRILLVSATAFEIAPIMGAGYDVDTLITGVGCPSAIYQLSLRLQQSSYDCVVQMGIAGGFSHQFAPGELCVVTADAFGDLGIRENGRLKPLSQSGLSDPDQFPFTGGWLLNDHPIINGLPFRQVKSITVNTVTDDFSSIRLLREAFQPDLETMEGAALHYVCLQQRVPFLQVRAISNLVGVRDKSQWHMEASVRNLALAWDHLFSRHFSS